MRSLAWQVHEVDSIDSTNRWVLERAREGASEGLVLRADFQTQGRGRRDRQWVAAPGSSLLCSILLRPPLGPDQIFVAVAATAIAVRDAVRDATGYALDIKWPNDLLAGTDKVGGILSEVLVTPAGPAIVIGLGLNLDDVDASLTGATSIHALTGQHLHPRELVEKILDSLDGYRQQMNTPASIALVMEKYRRALVTIGQPVRIEQLDGTWHGVATGLDDEGNLMVQRSDDTIVAVRVGDVVHVRREEQE